MSSLISTRISSFHKGCLVQIADEFMGKMFAQYVHDKIQADLFIQR